MISKPTFTFGRMSEQGVVIDNEPRFFSNRFFLTYAVIVLKALFTTLKFKTKTVTRKTLYKSYTHRRSVTERHASENETKFLVLIVQVKTNSHKFVNVFYFYLFQLL